MTPLKPEKTERNMASPVGAAEGAESSESVDGGLMEVPTIWLDWKLCYVERDEAAYFCAENPEDVWGDDWDDAPYEYNAGTPYAKSEKLYYEGVWLDQPCEGHGNSPYTVEQINEGKVPWLRSPDYAKESIVLYAGTTAGDFIAAIEAHGGTIYQRRQLTSTADDTESSPSLSHPETPSAGSLNQTEDSPNA